MKYKLLFFLVLIGTLIRPVTLLVEKKDIFFSPGYQKQYAYFKNSYDHSQYVQKKNPEIIPDEIFESFAAGTFIRGLNPILIVHDQPPLGRYIIGFSILLFNNQNTIVILLLFSAGLGVFLIGHIVLKNALLALIPLGIFINEPLFLNKLIFTPLLEPIQLPFIIFTLYFFLRSITSKRYFWWYIATGIMLGFVISTRFFILGLVEYIAMFFYLLLHFKVSKRTILFLFVVPLSLVILLASYIKTFQSGYSFIQVLGIQKYILAYHKSKFIEAFSFWDLLFFNRWHTWWGDKLIISDIHWMITWPIAYGLTLLSCFTIVRKKSAFSYAETVLVLWIFAYSLMLSTGYTSTRYFLPLLPFLYILAVAFLKRFIEKCISNR